ncbi:hypothetical protein HMPREF1210_00135 [Paenisporosarcina sp. HGH0030]|uniref:hypothetical protein n=1 Tax=Paenisporosarcina sp. HGH0030 TaxID=1078085 RepID=UPI00034E7872|nr:hypothetical protein [Paenisporosarcina sp. HGH0030]EPD54150.1 hypothetical protein HMPREF1210_00135 [Paenisporosarcina sp. HGH0030]
MELLFILGAVFIFCVIGVFFIGQLESGWDDKRKLRVEEIIKENEINVDKRHNSNHFNNVLIHDSINQNIWYIEFPKHDTANLETKNLIKKISYNDIIQVELMEDEESLIVTSRGSQLGGALVGGMLAGGVGALIGGLSGKQKQKREVKKIQLLATLDDLETPYLKMVIEEFDKPTPTNFYPYPSKYEEALNWFKMMEVIIKRSEGQKNIHEVKTS